MNCKKIVTKKRVTGVAAVLVALAIILTGTFAWKDFSQFSLNLLSGDFTTNHWVSLVDDFKSADETDGKTLTDWKRDEVAEKEVYISSKLTNAKANPTGSVADPVDVYDSVYVRVQLEQTLTLGGEDVPKSSPTTTWSSSDTAIASVDSATGIVTAVAAGIATITAIVDGKTVTIDVTVMPTVAGQTFADPETGTLWRVLVPTNAEGNALIILERVYNSGTLYNTTNVWTLYESSNLKNNATTGMDAWYNNSSNVGDALRETAIDYAYQDNTGNSVAKGTTGAGIEHDFTGSNYSWSATANVQRARTVAISTKGSGSAFALSVSEVNAYFTDNADRIAKDTSDTARHWWLRSPGPAETPASGVLADGSVYGATVAYAFRGFRVALWVNP